MSELVHVGYRTFLRTPFGDFEIWRDGNKFSVTIAGEEKEFRADSWTDVAEKAGREISAWAMPVLCRRFAH